LAGATERRSKEADVRIGKFVTNSHRPELEIGGHVPRHIAAPALVRNIRTHTVQMLQYYCGKSSEEVELHSYNGGPMQKRLI
jgi:hypothetical protein